MRRVVVDLGGNNLLDAVSIEEIAGNIHDGAALEQHFHAPVVRDDGDGRGCQVFFRREADKLFFVLFGDDDRHALLRFGDGEFRARQPFVFQGHFVEVDHEPVGKFADGDGNAARAEIVALFDLARDFGV